MYQHDPFYVQWIISNIEREIRARKEFIVSTALSYGLGVYVWDQWIDGDIHVCFSFQYPGSSYYEVPGGRLYLIKWAYYPPPFGLPLTGRYAPRLPVDNS